MEGECFDFVSFCFLNNSDSIFTQSIAESWDRSLVKGSIGTRKPTRPREACAGSLHPHLSSVQGPLDQPGSAVVRQGRGVAWALCPLYQDPASRMGPLVVTTLHFECLVSLTTNVLTWSTSPDYLAAWARGCEVESWHEPCRAALGLAVSCLPCEGKWESSVDTLSGVPGFSSGSRPRYLYQS